MASSKAGELPGSRSWGRTGRNPGLGAEPCLRAFSIQPSEFLHPPGVSCDLGDPEVSPARLPSRLSCPRPGDLLSTRARREKARLQGSCEVRRDRASRGDVSVRRTSRARPLSRTALGFGVALLIWRKQGRNVLWVQFLGGKCGTRNRRARDTTLFSDFLLSFMRTAECSSLVV